MTPEIVTSNLPSLYDLTEDDSLEVNMQVLGYPEPRVVAYKNESRVKLNEHFNLGKYYLIICKS